MLSAAADFDVLASQLMTQLREIEHLVEDERWADGNSAEVDSALQRGQDLHDQLSAQNIVIQLLFGTSTTALASVAALEAFRVKGATLSDMRSDASLAPMSSGELLHLLRVFNDSARRDMRRPLWLKRVWVREPK